MRADGYRSGGIYYGGYKVVESCGCALYCEPDGTAILEGGGCAAGGNHHFREFEETGMSPFFLYASQNITRIMGECMLTWAERIADQERI